MAAMIRTGDVIDGFTVGERLHIGGMATLWHVSKPGMDMPMLMKLPIIREGDDPATIVSFEMEQMIMPRLTGPHVPKCIAAGYWEEKPYIIMERVAGKTLFPALENLPMPLPELVDWAARIADALHSLHGQGVVHLDVKPSNIMRRPTGEVVLIDYGLAHHMALPDLMAEEFTLPYGTAPYMAPEQVLGQRGDIRSDLFALGVLMYFFATGKRPFGDPQRLRGLKKRIWWDPPPPLALNPALPGWFQEVVLRCLEVNARQRHPTAAQLAFDLRHPEQVQLTRRAKKDRQTPWLERMGRSLQQLEGFVDSPRRKTNALTDAPVVMAAIDFATAGAGLRARQAESVQRILEHAREARVACVNVLRQSRVAIDSSFDEDGKNKHLVLLAQLKDWARGLGLDESRLTFHVLESTDPAEAILDYARHNNVDHIVMGARNNSTMRRMLGSVSGKVASEAPCSVTVVRDRHAPEA